MNRKSAIAKRYRDKKNAQGTCIYCTRPSEPGSPRCKFHIEMNNKAALKVKHDIKQEVFEHYRSTMSRGNMYRWIRDNGFPSDLQLLCANCNQSKLINGKCEHHG